MAEQPPRDAIYLKWGKFEAGIFGKPAILALAFAVSVAFITRFFSLW